MQSTHKGTPRSGAASYWDTHVLNSGLDRSLIQRLSTLVAIRESERERFEVRTPFTLEPLGVVPVCSADDVQYAVQRARAAQPGWARRSTKERAAVLLRFHDLLLDNRELTLDLIQLESGKARRYALEEVVDTALVARHYGIHAESYLRPRRHSAALPVLTTAFEYRHPVGVVGFITPWNFPLILSITDLLAALAAGNAAVLRPDVQSPFTALWAAELLYRAGLPRDVLTVVTGKGSALGPNLIDAVDFIMFTGSTRTGKIVARQAAERLIGFSLELGGKNSMVVLQEADIDAAVDGLVRGAFTGAGQVCVSIERAWVPARMYDDFRQRLLKQISSMKISPELRYGIDMGSLTVESQITTVQDHINDAVAKGARVLAGGKTRPDLGPLFHEPTVLEGVTPGMTLYAEETFGPVVSLYPYTDLEEAINRVNDTRYGLNASVWSGNIDEAMRVARLIRTGTVNINESYAATWTATAAPIGGMKESGAGRRHGAEGILKYTEAQTVAMQRGVALAPPRAMSEERFARLVTRLVRVTRHIPGLR
jgi:acyl-CoA reductase-like NAD-dependent aldehyde dehydrogenase